MSLFEYFAQDGSRPFRPRAAAESFDTIADSFLEHDEFILRHLELEDEGGVLKLLIKEGYLEKNASGRLAIAPRGLRRIEDKALAELFTLGGKDSPGKHATDLRGPGQARHEDSKPYTFGDPVANLNLQASLQNALLRRGPVRSGAQRGEMVKGVKTRLAVTEEDLVVYETELETSCATVLLLDLSGSMARYGKFYHAKKVALALVGLIRNRYPEDTLKIIGFYTYASPLTERDLLTARPRPVDLFDSRVYLRIPLDDPPAAVPGHFTNIQAGLRFARHALLRQGAANRRIICVTDGEPTAHLEGRDLVLMYPPSERTARATLEEVRACAAAGIELSTFALVEDYFYLGLVNFVDQMARTGRGLAVYCKAGELGGYLLDSFVRGRRARKNIR